MAFPNQDPMAGAIQLMQLIQGIKARQQQTAQQHLENSLTLAQPGTTFGQLGLSEKDLKRALGRAPKPDEIAKVLTPDEVMRKQQLDLLQHATPEQLNVLSATSLATKAGAPAGLYTQQGFADTAGANAAEAKTQRKISESTGTTKVKTAQVSAQNQLKTQQTIGQAIDEGIKAWGSDLTGKQKSLIGQKTLFGQTGQEFTEQNVSSMLKAQIQREALKSTVDPSHPANKFWRELGMDPAAGIAMLGMGGESLINARLQMLTSLSINRQERETALQKADAEVAADIGKKFGVPAHTVMRELNNMDAGKPPTTGLGQALRQSMVMNYNAILTEGAIKNNPKVQELEGMTALFQKFGDNPDVLKMGAKAYAQKYAEGVAASLGNRLSTSDDPKDQLWGAALQHPENIKDPTLGQKRQQFVDSIANTVGTYTDLPRSGLFSWLPDKFGFSAGGVPQQQSNNGTPQQQQNAITPAQNAAKEGFIKALLNLQPGSTSTAPTAPNVPPAPQLGVPGLNPQK